MFHLPEYSEIPGVGLYLEQTLKYLNETFSSFKSVQLTKSMISNYVKLGYLKRPVKKQYDRDQIAALLFIAVSKQVLSMDNIGKFFRMQTAVLSTRDAYTAFKADFDYLLDIVWNQKVIDGSEAVLFMQPPVPGRTNTAPGRGAGAREEAGAAFETSPEADAGAAFETGPEADAGAKPGSAMPVREMTPSDAYALLWQVASADVYSIYLNELFEQGNIS